jgi:cytochrome c biogenesis protein CcdA
VTGIIWLVVNRRTSSEVVRVRAGFAGVGVALLTVAGLIAIAVDHTSWPWWLAATATLVLPTFLVRRRGLFRLTVAAVMVWWIGALLLGGLISLVVLPCAAWLLIAALLPWSRRQAAGTLEPPSAKCR